MFQSPDKSPRAFIILICLALIWGTSFILMKKGLVVFTPGEVGSIRVAAASLFLLPAALTRLKELQRRHYVLLFVAGMTGIFLPAFCFATAQTRLESSVTGIMNSLTPIFTLVIGVTLFFQKFPRRSVIGIIVGLGGTVILVLADSEWKISGINSFALFVILACLLYATYLNFVKYKISDLPAVTITSVSLLLVGPLAALYLFAFTGFASRLSTTEGAWTALGYVVLLGFMSTSLATILFNKLVKISSPLYASSVTYLIPIVAVLWGVADGESLYGGHFAGMAAIVGGVYLSNRKA